MLKPKKKVQAPKDEPEESFTLKREPEELPEGEDVEGSFTIKPKRKVEKIPEPESSFMAKKRDFTIEEIDDVGETVKLKPKRKVEAPREDEEASLSIVRQPEEEEVVIEETMTDVFLRPKVKRVETLDEEEVVLRHEAVKMGEETVTSDVTIQKKKVFSTQDLPAESVTLMQLDQTFEDIEGDYKVRLPRGKGGEIEGVEYSRTDAVVGLKRKGEKSYSVEETEGIGYSVRKKSFTSEEVDQDLNVRLRKKSTEWKTEEGEARLDVMIQLPEVVEGLEPVTQVEVGEVLELVVVVKKVKNVEYEVVWVKDGRVVRDGVSVVEDRGVVRVVRRVERVEIEEQGVHKVFIGVGGNNVSCETTVVVKRKVRGVVYLGLG